MAITQQREFLAQIHPFNQLDEALLYRLADKMDVVYWPEKTIIPCDSQTTQSFVYVVIKGLVVETLNNEVIGKFGIRSFFGEASLLGQISENQTYQVQEEVIAYRLPAKLFLMAYEQSAEFAQFFSTNLVEKLNQIHQDQQMATSTEVMMDTVISAPIQKMVVINEQASAIEAAQQMTQAKSDACLLAFQDGSHGIVTSTDLLKLMAQGDLSNFSSPSGLAKIANKPVYSVHEYDYLFNALLKMTRYQIDRLAVRNDEGFVGFLHQKDLMSVFANQSGLVLIKVDQATTVEDLIEIGPQIDRLVQNLNRKGIKTHYIAKLVNELHRKMIYKLTELLLPAELNHKVSVVVMGSEGRSEQVIRTDQDNALIYADDLSIEQQNSLTIFAAKFSQSLQEMGFPPCPGNIMLSNPNWRMTLSAFKSKIEEWFKSPSEENFMNAAILFDAECVFGSPEFLHQVKRALQYQQQAYPNFLRHFAIGALRFKTPVGFFGGLVADVESSTNDEVIDIKKGGIFAIVHGIRCYALEAGVEQTNTHWRIKQLMDMGILDKEFGIELGETLNFLNTLRLESMLSQVSQGIDLPDNKVHLSELSHLQQDILKESFKVVDGFKKRLIHHFGLSGMM